MNSNFQFVSSIINEFITRDKIDQMRAAKVKQLKSKAQTLPEGPLKQKLQFQAQQAQANIANANLK